MHRFLPLLALSVSTLQAQADTARRDTAYLAPTVITVVRTTIDIARAPYAVGVSTRDDIQRGRPGLALDEALAGIAGVQVDNRFNYALGERISIRGFGARAQFGVRGVRVLLDGIPMTLADGQTSMNNVDVASLGRAEVIRGPASAMHGNAAGGVIQLESDLASLATAGPVGGSVRTGFGDHGLLRTDLSVGGSARETQYLASASRLRFAGYRLWNDARNDRITFSTRHELGTPGALSFSGNWVEYRAKNPGGLDATLLGVNRDTVSASNFNNRTREQGRQAQLGAIWRKQFARIGLEASAHGIGRQVDNPIPGTIVVIDREAGGARVALTAAPASGARSARLSAGVETQLQHDDRRNYRGVGGERDTLTLNQFEKVNNTAVFAQGVIDVTPRLLAMLGARFDRMHFQASDRLISAGNADDSGERTMSAASPSVGLTFAATSLLRIYSNYSTSFETPTTSELSNRESGAGGLNPALDPQRTRSFEVGMNGGIRLPATAGSWQLALYEARVTDALIPFEVASAPGRQYFRNAGSTRNRGIEAATSLFLPSHLSLRASFTHTQAEFVDYSVTSGATTTRFDGNAVPGVAANRADATLSFQPRRFFLDWDTRASSAIPVNDANSASSPSFVIHGARLGARDVHVGRVSVAPHVGVMNLFDRDYNTSVVVNAFGGRFYEPGPPRSFYGGMILKF